MVRKIFGGFFWKKLKIQLFEEVLSTFIPIIGKSENDQYCVQEKKETPACYILDFGGCQKMFSIDFLAEEQRDNP